MTTPPDPGGSDDGTGGREGDPGGRAGGGSVRPWVVDVAVEDDVVLPVHVTPARAGTAARAPVLLLHGFPGSWRSFDAVVPALAAEGRPCLVPEQRGYAATGRPRDVGRYRLDRLVADAVAVLEALPGALREGGHGSEDEDGSPGPGPERVSVVGHDWGAVVAWALAAAHPERVADLVAVSVPHPRAYVAGLREDRGQQLRSSYVRLLRRRGTAERVLLAGGGRGLRAAFAGSAVRPDLVDAHLRPLVRADELAGALAWYRALRGRDLDAVPAVAVPTTYLWSDRDAFVARGTAARCGDHVVGPYRARTLHGVSHWVPEERPEELVHAVRSPPPR
ncbi:alpha/beta hydrolase [Pseudokineococcus basanitobsidens]|uniref:Alpha/beta hydrolase n=1 Tax=Pseudokineococcus basanitobsidens TaxID=1926649 RepID=A0ABU8RHR5_9ACTN